MMNSATKSKLKNPWVIFVVIGLAFLSIYAIKELYHEQKKQEYANRLYDVIFTIATEEYKLEDVEIELANTYLYKESFHSSIDLRASNLEALGYPRMLKFYDDLPERAEDITENEFGIRTGYSIRNLRCGEDEYDIYTSTRSIYKNGRSIYDDYWHSDSHNSYLERHPEEKANDTARKAGLPYVGMSEANINSTTLGAHNGKVRHNYECINGQQYLANIYDFSGTGGVIFSVRCVNGKVTQVWDHRDSPLHHSASQTNSSGESSDPYNAKDYHNAEDFYEYHYDDFMDFYDAENYFNDHT